MSKVEKDQKICHSIDWKLIWYIRYHYQHWLSFPLIRSWIPERHTAVLLRFGRFLEKLAISLILTIVLLDAYFWLLHHVLLKTTEIFFFTQECSLCFWMGHQKSDRTHSKDTFPKTDKWYFIVIYAFVVGSKSCYSPSDLVPTCHWTWM